MANERLIDADALIAALRSNEGAEALGHSTYKLFKVLSIIDGQPNVDAVEVVRCKDCKHFNQLEKGCDYHGYWYHVRVEEDAFCSYGERRIDNA